jgi:hypothetical protein
VIRVKDRLAMLYDAPGNNSVDHMRRDIGLAWLKLPLVLPDRVRNDATPKLRP